MAFDAIDGPFGTYTITQVISAAAQTEILAAIDSFLALLPNSSTGAAASGDMPDADAIRPEYETKVRVEIAALRAAIDAAPTA